MKRFCFDCMKVVDDTADVCPQCGGKVEETAVPMGVLLSGPPGTGSPFKFVLLKHDENLAAERYCRMFDDEVMTGLRRCRHCGTQMETSMLSCPKCGEVIGD